MVFGIMDGIRAYTWTANGYEHSRQDVRSRIVEQDNGTSYLLYALRSGGIKKVRAILHGLDHWTETSVVSALWRIVNLKRAQAGNAEEMASLVDFFAPQYTLPTEGVWEYKMEYVDLLVAQERIPFEQRNAYLARVAQTHSQPEQPKSTAWSSLFSEGLRQ
eukprot:TRINITY_DN9201_c0_g2_i1.p2 TRINITY_DN9201_c0_g2~~TRINITY_DN9201_c0_g2_i1.p2  ORF type:complete len:161 (+),score=45.51 TRINITY_DN9201_c0_g2_i1:68-550(+)